jgi:hypothetical protein
MSQREGMKRNLREKQTEACLGALKALEHNSKIVITALKRRF